MSNTVKGTVFAVIGAILWGTYGTFVAKLVSYGFSESAIAVLAPTGLILFFFIMAMLHNPKSMIPTKKQFLIYLFTGIVGVTGTNILYAAALATGFSVGMASVITFANYFIVMIASRFLWKIKITPPKIGAGIIALIGIAMLLQIWTDLSFSSIGLILVIATAFTFAFSYTFTKFAFENAGSEPDAFYCWINLIGFIVTCFINPPWKLFAEVGTVYSSAGIVAIIVLLGFILIPQCGSYFFLGRAFQRLEAPIVVVIYCLDPITSSILGFLFLGQVLNPIQILGMLVIIAGLVWLQISELKHSQDLPSAPNS